MQKNHQPDKQFLEEMGVLLAARASQQGRMAPPLTISHFAEYIASARRHQKLTQAVLAQKMGISEAKIYALEQGLLSFADLDVRFLSKLAIALDEELATLLLLLGRPALVQALQIQEAHNRHDYTHHSSQDSSQGPALGQATASKQRGNRFAFNQWMNALSKGCLDLIDSLQQGRLSSYSRVNFKASYRLYPVVAAVLCLFLVGLGTYNHIAGDLGAQSTIQSDAMMSVRPDGLPAKQLQRGIDDPAAQSPQRLYLVIEARTQPVTASIAGPESIIALREYEGAVERQQCVMSTVRRPAICRV